MYKLFLLVCVAGCFLPATLMAEVEKVTLEGNIKGLDNEELVLLNSDWTEITRTKTENDHFKIMADLEIGDLRYYLLYVPSVGPLGPSMSIPTISFFVDASQITVLAELKEKQMKLLKLKGSSGSKEYDRIVRSLPTSKRMEEIYENYNRAFHEYNMVSQTPENREKLKAASKALDRWQAQKRQEIFDLLPRYKENMPFAVLIFSYFNFT